MDHGLISRFRRDGLVGAEGPGGRLGARIQEEQWRGRHAWSGLADHALEHAAPAELYRDLYAVAGQAWIDAGARDHYVLAAASGPLREAWLGLSFFVQQVHAARPLAAGTPPPPPVGYRIRRGGTSDAPATTELALQLHAQQLSAPCWAGGVAGTREQEIAETREELARDAVTLFLAEAAGRPAGMVLMEDQAPGTVNLRIAAVGAQHRGRGVGAALTEHALAWAHRQGHTICLTDWRVANLLASRFWPARGFVPDHCRYVRYVRPAVGVRE